MSGVTDFVSKAFKSVKKVATKLWDNKLIRAAIIAVAVYYTAGLASQAGWFAPAAGEGSTLAAAGANGTTFTTVAESGATVSSIGAETASAADIAGTAMAAPATAAAPVSASGGVLTGTEIAGTAGAEMAAGAVAPGAAAAPAAASPGIVGSTMGWMQANPMATMMLGQGVSGAVSSHEARKAEDRAREERQSYGAMGFDRSGAYKGPGVINSQRQPAATEQQKVRSVKQNQLPDLYKQGYIS